MAEIAHLTDEQRTQIVEKCALMQQFYMTLRSEMEAKPKHEDLSSSLSDVEKKQMLFEAEVNAILSTPPPPPPKKEEEKKAEDGAAPADGEAKPEEEKPAGADAEMKDEAQADDKDQPEAAAQ